MWYDQLEKLEKVEKINGLPPMKCYIVLRFSNF